MCATCRSHWCLNHSSLPCSPNAPQLQIDAVEAATLGGPLQAGKWSGWVPFGSTTDNGELQLEIRYDPPPPMGTLLITAHEVGMVALIRLSASR